MRAYGGTGPDRGGWPVALAIVIVLVLAWGL